MTKDRSSQAAAARRGERVEARRLARAASGRKRAPVTGGDGDAEATVTEKRGRGAGVSRNDVVQGFLSLYDAPSYLEVGVSTGATFHALTAARKVAVDPAFRFDVDKEASERPECTYLQIESDEYFGSLALDAARFDVIYLDGLHTFEQTLRDLVSAVSLIKDDGVIVIDDVYPSSFAASVPDMREFRKLREALGIKRLAWMGDVYKLVFFVETFFQQFSYRTISDNHGQLVMWRQPRAAVERRDIGYFERMSYREVVLDRERFRFARYEEILAEVKEATGR